MKRLKIRVFSSGKLAGEGHIGSFLGGTIGCKADCNVISSKVRGKIKIWKNLRGKIVVHYPDNSLREIIIDGTHLDRHILKKIKIMRSRSRREVLILPAKSLLKLMFEGFDLIIMEEKYVREAVAAEVTVSAISGEFRRKPFADDLPFLLILTASLICYATLHTTVLLTKAPKINVRKDIPRRFTRLIYEPPVAAPRSLEREISLPKKTQVEKEKVEKEKVEKAKEEKVAKKTEPLKEK